MHRNFKVKSEVLDREGIDRALTRIAHEILEKNKGAKHLALVGIRKRGDILAERIAKKIESIEKVKVPVGAVDITFYRDDYDIKANVDINATDLNFSVDGLDIVIVDDVLFTGRSTRAAMDVIIENGRPKSIQLAVLVDRGHRELPIQANYVGKNVPTSEKETIILDIETNGEDKVYVAEKPEKGA
ncbi:MAG: bifunctional pyr operon transcriptional regulator/uracil phosphoribosyltransferase PyrR [Candidatus Goldiibacteriota bacterium HGW-Goldbacteria-1]|jgi:pyrimidine operon attenuation protein/uracil phosphoribosyltransferase|nr:MAG: bifunctional pyr operon transcriptional regulator/uracil phosphoribosyltransferase PyrR [Candidatus Goldiibacteriota bacterium HGW-Goldbacteria-1]